MAKIIAHRANLLGAPENSLQAISYCVANSVEGIELDIRHSSDGVGHIFHDSDFLRLCTSSNQEFLSKKIYETTSSEITKNASLSNTEKIPKLEEALDLIKNKNLLVFLELKDRPNEKTFSIIKNYFTNSNAESLRIISFDHNLLKEIKNIDSYWKNIKTLALHEFPRTTWISENVPHADGINSNLLLPAQVFYLKAKRKEVGLWWLTDKIPSLLNKTLFPFIDFFTTDNYFNYRKRT